MTASRALVVCSLYALCAPTAHASELQNCQTLAIGDPSNELFVEKSLLRDFIGSLSPQDLDWPASPGHPAPVFKEQIEAYRDPLSAPWSYNGCAPGTQLRSLSSVDKERIERAWVLEEDQQSSTGGIPVAWLKADATDYTLAEMEDTNACVVMGPDLDWDPLITFLASWEDPTNPYYADPQAHKALQRRGASWLALQLIQLDWNHWGSQLPPVGGASNTRFQHPPQGLSNPPWLFPAPGVNDDINGSREFAGQLGHLVQAYRQVEAVIDPQFKPAFETMFVMYAERLHTWGLSAIELNLTIRGTWALYDTWLATQDPDVLSWYQQDTDSFYDPNNGWYHPAGYFNDDGRYDSGYNGYNMLHTMSILSLDPNASSTVRTAAAEMFDLRAHLLFRDPDGTFYAPNAFNTRSSKATLSLAANPNPQASSGGDFQTYVQARKHGMPYADAFLRNEPNMGPSLPGHFDPLQVPDDPFYRDVVCSMIGNAYWKNLALDNLPPQPMVEWGDPAKGRARAYGTPHFGVSTYTAGELADWHHEVLQQPELERFPFELPGPHLRAFSDEFVFAKQGVGAREDAHQDGTFATLLHAGPVGPGYGAISGGRWLPQGLGGGEISMWWTPWGGAFIRTLRKGYNNEFNASTVDDPLAWRSWAMHAVSLMSLAFNPDGSINNTTAPFTSSARIIDPDRHITFYQNPPPTSSLRRLLAPEGCGTDATATGVDGDPDVDAAAVRVHVCGDIPVLVQRWAALPQPALVAPMPYERTFYVSERETVVSTTVNPDPSLGDRTAEAWETIPIYSQEVPGAINYGRSTIWLVPDPSTGAAPVDGTYGTAPIADIIEVLVARAEGVMRISFEAPQWIGVSDEAQFGDSFAWGWNRNLQIDLLEGHGPSVLMPKTVTYHIEAIPIP